jgi:glycosyltransferase involved in cell wall biosynthesis
MSSAALGPKPFLSLCAIVKNESENLGRCLASVQPYVDEIIVVDTGSEDGTPEIASQYGAKVGYFESVV